MDAGLRLVTERLVLRPWQPAEAPRVLDLYGRLEVVRWLGDGEPVVMTDEDQARRTVARFAELSEAPPVCFLAAEVAATGVIAGTVLLNSLPGEGAEVEIAWHFHPDSWGHGYATEAARALMAYGFAGGLSEIWALTHLGHERSIAVCRRLGLRHRGREQGWYDVPMEVFSLTTEEYDAGRVPGSRWDSDGPGTRPG